jgi:hypothetical protein
MPGLDYTFVQELIDFGREMAGEMVGQPFDVYRLNNSSTGDVLDPSNKLTPSLPGKLTHSRTMDTVENDILKANTFELLAPSNVLAIGDVLVQQDVVYGGDSRYAVVSKRPLKPVMVARVEANCYIKRVYADHDGDGYNGSNVDSELPYVLNNGVFSIGAKTDTPAVIPCGVTTIAQLKNMKPERLPLDVTTSWWYIFVPYLPGLQRIRENDVVYHNNATDDDVAIRYRVQIPLVSDAGTAGQFLVCERMTP